LKIKLYSKNFSISNSNTNTSNNNQLKRNDSLTKQLKKDDSLHNLTKFRCPSSNPSVSKPSMNTFNRYKDIFIDHPDDDIHTGGNNMNYPSNPFSAGGNMKNGNRINNDSGNMNNYKNKIISDYSSNQSTQKLYSTSKKKV
jgi:hypothetical protein